MLLLYDLTVCVCMQMMLMNIIGSHPPRICQDEAVVPRDPLAVNIYGGIKQPWVPQRAFKHCVTRIIVER